MGATHIPRRNVAERKKPPFRGYNVACRASLLASSPRAFCTELLLVPQLLDLRLSFLTPYHLLLARKVRSPSTRLRRGDVSLQAELGSKVRMRSCYHDRYYVSNSITP